MNAALSAPMRISILLACVILVLPVSAAGQKFQVLHAFAGGTTDGSGQATTLALDRQGNLFGVTVTGGSNTCNSSGCGIAFRLSPVNGRWQERVLYNFSSPNGQSLSPNGTLALDSHGNVYGVEYNGGGSACNCGTVYELSRTGGVWSENVLHYFSGQPDDGFFASSGLVQDASGNLYGSTFEGGAANSGTIFELTPGAAGTWNYSVIYEFQSSSNLDGNSPYGPLTIDSSGNIYGTTQAGGIYSYGTVFKLSPNGNGWTESIIYNFTLDYSQTQEPFGVVPGPNGVLYGVTFYGGEYTIGTLYELTPAVGFWNRSVLYTFTGSADGAYPYGGLTIDAAGNLYGISNYGGSFGYGNVFKFQKLNGKWKETILHSFANGTDGSHPYLGVTLDKLGNVYGSAQGGAHGLGVVFEITP